MYNRTISLLFFLFLFFNQDAFGQAALSDDLLNTIDNETCECLNEKIPKKETSSEKLELNIGLCLMRACSNHRKELSESGVTLEDANSFEMLSEQIGERMAKSCDKFVEILFILMNDENSDLHLRADEEVKKTAPVVHLEKMTGIVNNTEEGLLLRIWVKHDKGADVFICLDSFEGIDLVKDLEKLKGQNVHITYEKIEVYSASEKGMIQMKKLTGMKIVN